MATLPEDVSDGLKLAIDELESAVTDIESRLESARAERDEAKARQVELELENAGLRRELRLARDRQNAGAEILRSIAGTSGDAERSLYQIAETSARLFGGPSATIHIAEGDGWAQTIRVGDSSRRIGAEVSEGQLRIGGHNLPGTVVAENRQVHIPDLDHVDPAIADWPGLPPARAAGTRSIAGAPLRLDGRAIGALIVYRDRLAPFADDELALLQSFADQAAIAIENARLFNETKEALERQTATAEILKVIASSPSDVQPVFEAIVDSAAKLFEPCSATITTLKDDRLHWNATAASIAGYDVDRARSVYPIPFDPDRSPSARAILERRIIEIPDIAAPDTPEFTRSAAAAGGFRSITFVPLVDQNQGIGTIIFTHPVTGFRFSERQLALIRTFADQAVIAIGNAHLFDEVQAKTRDLTESLQQQTATAEVLKVISRSAFDLQKVLDALLASACRLCEADIGTIRYLDGNTFRLAATFGCKPEWIEHFSSYSTTPDRTSIFGRTIVEGHTVHVPDVLADPDFKRPNAQKLMGFRAAIGVPLVRDGQTFGVVSLFRLAVGSFTEKQIELVSSFADQAVIAIENVRLFDELQARTRDLTEALTHQTGSANILRVIASSPTDVGPVLRAIVENACGLCEAHDAVALLRDGDDLRIGAHHGPIPIDIEKWPINRRWTAGRAFVDQKPVHVRDLLADESADFTDGRELSRRMGHRSILSVPLLRENESIGAIVLRRTEVHPFSDKQIKLLQTFADQAVIAIGNVRLFEEVQAKTRDLTEALQFQTATSDVLKVISQSPDTLQPVLDAIAETSRELCGSDGVTIFLLRDGKFHFTAVSGVLPKHLEYLRANPAPIDEPGSALRQLALKKRTVHYPNVMDDPELDSVRSSLGGPRALLLVPLMREGEVIGAIVLRQSHLRPFTPRQIQAIETFADQAVIAISNVNLFDQVQARTRDLSESLQQQTATADVLKVISRSTFDLQAVLSTLLESAARLCGADLANIWRPAEGAAFHMAASFGVAGKHHEWLENKKYLEGLGLAPGRGSIVGRTLLAVAAVQVQDVQADPDYELNEIVRIGDYRTMLGVPLLREGIPVGVFVLTRCRVEPFTDKQIELVSSFADQAVIAIENVRLFDEVEQRTRELSASLEELRTAQDRLIQTEKLASLGQLTAGIAHEIKNPLNFVNNFAALSAELTDELNEALKPVRFEDSVREAVGELTGLLKDNLEKVVQHGKRADSIVKNMLLHSREGSGDHRPADINALLDESLNLAYHGARAEKPAFNVTLQRDFDPAAGTIEIFPQEITRVFLNLISNGFYAVTRRKAELGEADFDPLLSATTKDLGDTVEIRIRDNGIGIPPEVKEKMFNPFFTTKPAGEGTGLGLSMSHDIIVKQHGGSIDVATEPGQFTEFIIVLPRASHLNDRNRGQT